METKVQLQSSSPFQGQFKCRFCTFCGGYGCKGELPGMGGVNNNSNFIKNVEGWRRMYLDFSLDSRSKEILNLEVSPNNLGIAPITGAMQNIGFTREEDFYLPYFTAASNSGITISVGDGAPDNKLVAGYNATKSLKCKSAFFLKPYPDSILQERIDLVRGSASSIGMDIDAFNIITMRDQVHLEHKSASQILQFKEYTHLPFIIKGVFTKDDVQLCQEVHPDVIVVSNHGGRIDTEEGSTAEFLFRYGKVLKSSCYELWVDGGIRTHRDIQVALYMGASKVLIGRPFISSLLQGGIKGMEQTIKELID